MSLKRYDSVGWEEMDESPTGEFVKLQDIIKLLEDNKGQNGLISVEYAQWLIKGESK